LLLRKKFPSAHITALDISENMIKAAKEKLQDNKTRFITKDAEVLDLKEKFDLVTSNACFQWFENLEQALIKYRGMLEKGGKILFSIFGPRTYRELRESLENALPEAGEIASSTFMDKNRIDEIIKVIFRDAKSDRHLYMEHHNRLSDLLKKIKYTGARGNGNGALSWGPKKIQEVERIYKEKFKSIDATSEVFFYRGSA